MIILDLMKANQRANTLQVKYDTLKEVVKNELYKEFMKKLDEPTQIDRYKKENKRLRKQVKTLKEIVKEGK